jgi:hypothetical protein
MRTWWMLSAVLIGCNGLDASEGSDGVLTEADLVDDADPAQPLPPPLPVVMDLASTPWGAGQVATLTAEGAIPGARVFFLSGQGLGTTCPARLGGDCLDITGLGVLGNAVADGSGTAVLDVVVDAALAAGDERHLQAVVAAGAPYASSVASVVVDGVPTGVEDVTLVIDGGRVYRNNPASGLDWDVDPFGIFDKPDPYFILWLDGVYVGDSGTANDTRTPSWNVAVDLTVPEGSVVDIDVYDDDGFAWQGGDDYIGTLTLTHDDLQSLVDTGLVSHVGTFALQELEVEVLSR